MQYRSAYRKFHSSEIVLRRINNDILSSMNEGRVTALTLLDLSAAFDIIDYTILYEKLDDWIKSYLTGRC